jgi:hypothetical protein
VATLHRVFRRVDVVAFEHALGAWPAAVAAALPEATEAIAIDGKMLRGSRQPTVPAVHLLSALGHEVGLVLAEVPVAAQTDEVGALPALVAALVQDGRVCTRDAAFTERPVAETMRAKGGTI